MILNRKLKKRRFIYFGVAVAVAAAALMTRRFAAELSDWNKLYLGDVLWATALFFAICAVFPRWSLVKLILCGLLICWTVEAAQLYQAEWIMEIRRGTIGGLILGRGFLWSDILAYTAGILIGAGAKSFLEKNK